MKRAHPPILFTILLVALLLLPFSVAVASEITLAAADSTCATLKEAGEIFSRQQGVTIHYICKSSGVLAQGLQSSYINADYFISASQEWMNSLVSAGLIEKAAVKPLWDNTIIAVAPRKSAIKLQSWEDLASPKVTTIIVGAPSTTPLGRQFKMAMLARGLWLKIRPKLVTKVHISETRDGIISANDTTVGIMFPSNLESQLKTVLDMPQEWHDPIRYYAGPLRGSKKKEEIASFEAFLKGAVVNDLFRRQGYRILP